jgi:hypothetical protein
MAMAGIGRDLESGRGRRRKRGSSNEPGNGSHVSRPFLFRGYNERRLFLFPNATG